MSVEGWAFVFLRQIHLSHQQTLQVLEPYNYQMPSTEENLQATLDRIRRIGHQAEHRPGTLASVFGHNMRMPSFPTFDAQGHYHALDNGDSTDYDAPPAFPQRIR